MYVQKQSSSLGGNYCCKNMRILKKEEINMAWKNGKDLREDFSGVRVKDKDVYDGNDKKIGYVCGDGDIRVTEKGANYGQLYHMKD